MIVKDETLRRLIGEACEVATGTWRCATGQAREAGGLAWRVRLDALLAILLATLAVAYAVTTFYSLNFEILVVQYDSWFDSDTRRIVRGNEGLWSPAHHRTKVHPLFALLVALPLNVVRLLGVGPQDLAALLIGVGTFVFVCAFFTAARVVGLRRLDAAIATVLMCSTSAAMFWLATPETYALGGASMLLCLIWLGCKRGEHDFWTAPLTSILSLSITVTNWMAGIVAVVIGLGIKRGVQVTIFAFAVVSALTIVQFALFPESGRLFDFREESYFIASKSQEMLGSSLSIGDRLLSLSTNAFLAPEPAIIPVHQGLRGVGFDSILPMQLGLFGWLAAAGWIALAGLGAYSAWQRPSQLNWFIASLLLGQLALHLVYGHTLFIYSLHYAPFLVLVMAQVTLTRLRVIGLTLMGATAIVSLIYNYGQVVEARAALQLLAETAGPPP